MNLVAVVGSARKGRATDTLVEKAIEGARAGNPDLRVKKICLSDYDIRYCRDCLACRDSAADGPLAPCVIRDDMDRIYPELLASDALIFGTPVHAAYPTALMMAFLERITWTLAKPGKSFLTVHGCPIPRSEKKRKAVIIVVSGIVPPIYRRFCDRATGCIKSAARWALNAKTVGGLYAGDIEHRGVERYFDRAYRLGRKLV